MSSNKISVYLLSEDSQPGLREETLLEMKRKRHAYGHEVVALVDEVLALRRKLNRPEPLEVCATSESEIRAQRLIEAALAVDGCMRWIHTPQGHAFWEKVDLELRANARAIQQDPQAFT